MHVCEAWSIISAQVKVGHQTLSTHINLKTFNFKLNQLKPHQEVRKQTFSCLLLLLMFRNKNLTTTNIELRIPGIPFATPRCACFLAALNSSQNKWVKQLQLGSYTWATQKKTTSNFPSNPGGLIPGPLFDGLWNNPYIVGQDFIPYKSPKQPGAAPARIVVGGQYGDHGAWRCILRMVLEIDNIPILKACINVYCLSKRNVYLYI